jgi:hypothetical protein
MRQCKRDNSCRVLSYRVGFCVLRRQRNAKEQAFQSECLEVLKYRPKREKTLFLSPFTSCLRSIGTPENFLRRGLSNLLLMASKARLAPLFSPSFSSANLGERWWLCFKSCLQS